MAKASFSDFMREIEAEAKVEGPKAVEELETLRDYFRLARELAEARKAKRLSQQELALRSGVHQSEISDIERGRARRQLHAPFNDNYISPPCPLI